MKADREGRFKVKITKHGLIANEADNRLAFAVEAVFLEEMTPAGWRVLGPGDDEMTMTGWFNVINKDGTLNDRSCGNIKAAVGWDGRDPFWLQEADLCEQVVQATLLRETFETKSGVTKTELQWKYIDSADSEGSVGRVSDEKKRAIMAKFGAMFRASAGGAPAPAPAAKGKPTAPKPPAAKKAMPKAMPPAVAPSTMEACWDKWCEIYPDAPAGPWLKQLAKLFPDKGADDITGEQWGKFLYMLTPAPTAPAAKPPAPAAPAAPASPIAEDAEHFTSDQIPF